VNVSATHAEHCPEACGVPVGTIALRRDFQGPEQVRRPPVSKAGSYRRLVRNKHVKKDPNTAGYDWDPIALHAEMKEAGLLHRAAAAE
jgi:hypothetical protein